MLKVGLAGIDKSGSWRWARGECAPHSGTPLDLLHVAGSAAATIGFGLLFTRTRRIYA